MAKRRKDEEERVNDSRSVIDRATEARRQREAEIAARRQEEPNVSTTPEPSSPRESGRRKGGNSQFSGWADDVRSYTPGGRKKRDNTTSKRWARELDSENQRSEQMGMRRREQERARRKEQAEDLSPKKQREEQVKAMREAWRGKDPDASRKVTTDASQTKVPATPLRTSGTSSKPKAEPETPGEFFPSPSDTLADVATPKPEQPTTTPVSQTNPDWTEAARQSAQGYQEEQDAIREGTRANHEAERTALKNELAEIEQSEGYIYDPDEANRVAARKREVTTRLGELDQELGTPTEGPVNWDGRKELIDEYTRLWNRKYGGTGFIPNPLTPEEEARLEEVHGLLEEGDKAAGNESQYYAPGERMIGATEGGLKSIYGNIVNAGVTAADALLETGTMATPGSQFFTWTPEWQQKAEADAAKIHDFFGPGYEYVDRISDSAAKEIELAKGGLSEFGKGAVDAYNSILGMGVDMSLAPLTGGSSLAAMFVRTFGGAAKEARDAGADIFDQAAYGLTSSAIEVLTEKMGDGLAGVYGAGASDELAHSIIDSLTDSKVGRALLNVLFSAIEEGNEEVVSDLLAPFSQQIYDDNAIRNLIENGYPEDQIIYDFLIGAAIGAGGGSLEAAGVSFAPENGEERSKTGPDEVLAEAATGTPAQGKPGIRQAPGMEIGQEADGGEGKPFSPADALAESATPTAEGERKTNGEDRAEEEAPPEPKTPSETPAEAATPKAEEERRAETEEKPEEKPEAKAEETKEKGPGEILTEAATPKEEEGRKTTGEEKAEGQSPEAPKTPAEKRSRASELRNQASKLWDEIEAAENSHANEDPDAADYYEGLGEEAERLEAEAESLEKEAEEDELWGASEPVSPAGALAEAATPKGDAAEAPSEAAESKKGSDHESVPPSTRESTAQGEAKLNNGKAAEEAAQRKQARIEAAEADTIAEADRLSTEFEQDPVNVQRFQDGQGTYSQYSVQERLAVLQHLFPEADYYISGGDIVKGRTFDTTTGQSETFGDTRTGSNHRRPKMRPTEKAGVKPPNLVKPTEYAKMKQSQAGQPAPANGTIDTNSDAYTSQNGGAQDVHRHGQHKQGRQIDPRAESYLGRSAIEFDAETDEQRSNVEVVKRIAGEKTQVRFVDADSTEANGCWGLTIYNDDGTTTVLLRTGHPKGAVGERVAAVHEAVHAAFDKTFGHKSNYSASSNLFVSFKAAHPELADAADAYLLKVSKIILAKKGNSFGLPPFDPTAKNADTVAAYAMKKNPDFCGASCNEFFAYMASGSVNSTSNDAADVVSALQRAAQEMLMDGRIVEPGMFDDAPSHIDFYNTPSSFSTSTYETLDPGQNKSWGESLKANDPGEAPETGERFDDDMTPLNEQSREQDEKRREQAKADTIKRMGRENHERMTKALDKLDGFAKEFTERYGEVETDEHGGIVEDKDGNEVKNSVPNDVAKRLRSMLEGEETVQSFREYYESLRPAEGESSQTDSNYFYDGALAETLSQFADAERELIYAEKGGPANAEKAVQFGEGLSKEAAKEKYDKAAEAFALSLGARLGHLQRNFENKVKFNGEVEANAKEEKSGLKGLFNSRSDAFWRTQMRVDTFLKSLVGFSGKAEVANDLAQRTADSTIKRNNVRNGGREFFRKLAKERKSRKALADFEAGKTKGNVNIPGLGKVSMDYEVAVLKTLMTNGALDHIARFGAQFLNETDYRKGTNNNGRGDTEGYKAKHRITREALDQMAKDSLAARDEKLTGKAIYKEKISILKSIRAELMRDVSADPTAKAVYDASVEAMQYLAGEINDTTLRLYGLAKALQGSTYWPMTVYGRGNNLQFINNQAFTLEDASYLQHRRGGSGALFIAPFTETMDNYINRASKFVGFGELNSDLLMMSKEMGVGHGEHDAEKQSIQSTISKVAGEKAADYMRRYVELLNGQNRGPSKIGSTLRGNLARSSLVANPGVAIKQTASYMNAAGIIDFDLLLKNRLVTLGGLRTARSYDNNALIQAINERTGMLKSRSADNTVELGEANSARELSNRLTKWMPNWLTNWIQTQDYKTIANLALACGEQVKRNHNGRIDTNSDAYYSEVAKLLEQVTAKTQPIYDAEFRAEYLRSDSELVRMLAMFRTQQSQNLNNLMQAYGELSAAKREGGDVKAASRKVNQTVAGFVAAQTVFAVLSSAAKMLLHKQKDYEDEDGNIDIGKVAKRLGLDFLESAAGVVWFGDTLAKVAVDAATGVYAKATGKKEAATQEFYQLSDNTISIVNNLLSSFLKAVKDPSAKNIKTAVFDASQATGIPARNLYNIANSAIMYYKDARGQNPENYDDIISLMEKRAKMTPAQRTKATANEAMSLFRKGEIDKGYALLATLDYSDRNVVKNTKTVAGQAYINGDIDEATYRRVLASTKMTKSEIDKAVGSKSIDKTITGLAKYDEDKYGSLPDEIEDARANAGEGRSKSSAAARIIVDAAMSKNGQDAFMAKYTTTSYQKAFNAASKVKGAGDVVDALAAIDTNRNDSFTQEELYLYAQETGHDELVRAIWEANGWKTSYDTYRKNQAKKKG